MFIVFTCLHYLYKVFYIKAKFTKADIKKKVDNN